MFERILVALDGSDVAEQILPQVQALAERFGSAVLLFRVTTPPETLLAATAGGASSVAGPIVDPTPIAEAEREDAVAYLQALAKDLRRAGLAAEYEQAEGSPAEAIVGRARDPGVDLIAMTTHGRGGLTRLVVGSIAEAVLRSASCPILLVRVSDRKRA